LNQNKIFWFIRKIKIFLLDNDEDSSVDESKLQEAHQIEKHSYMRRTKAGRATIPAACRLLGVASLKQKLNIDERIKLISDYSSSSSEDTEDGEEIKLDFFLDKKKNKNFLAKTTPTSPKKSKKKVISLIFDDPMKKFMDDRSKKYRNNPPQISRRNIRLSSKGK